MHVLDIRGENEAVLTILNADNELELVVKSKKQKPVHIKLDRKKESMIRQLLRQNLSIENRREEHPKGTRNLINSLKVEATEMQDYLKSLPCPAQGCNDGIADKFNSDNTEAWTEICQACGGRGTALDAYLRQPKGLSDV